MEEIFMPHFQMIFKKKTIPELYEEIGNYMIKQSSKFFDKEKEIKELYS